MYRRLAVLLVAASLIAVGCKSGGGGSGGPSASPPVSVPGFPSSMVALGDSLTAAFGSCLAPTACPRNSWATGDGSQVNSHYRRILKANPAISDRQANLAKSGAKVGDLRGQAEKAVQRPADYITILIGANDACRDEMTAPTAFRAELDSALAVLRSSVPNSQLLMVGIPNVYRVWEIGHTNKMALSVWRNRICPNLLANAESAAPADDARRQAFRDRIASYNVQIKNACADYGSRCRYNDIAGFAFEVNLLSAVDFFHPNAAGQNALADLTYPGTFDVVKA